MVWAMPWRSSSVVAGVACPATLGKLTRLRHVDLEARQTQGRSDGRCPRPHAGGHPDEKGGHPVMLFLNHSCEPNVGFSGNIVLVAMRDISAARSSPRTMRSSTTTTVRWNATAGPGHAAA